MATNDVQSRARSVHATQREAARPGRTLAKSSKPEYWSTAAYATGAQVGLLPEDLSELDNSELEKERDARDRRVARLMRRWPELSRPEMRELRRAYAERLRLARYVGRLRRAL